MRTKLLAVGLLLCCLVVGLGARSPENKRWEYRTEETFTTDIADQLGQQGWELVTTVPKSNVPYDVRYIFKRAR